jgi:hypothetical protein
MTRVGPFQTETLPAGALNAAGAVLYNVTNLPRDAISLTYWNDNFATKKLVLACLDNSIAALESGCNSGSSK